MLYFGTVRVLLYIALLSLSVSASPLKFAPLDKKARGFQVEAGGDWIPSEAPSSYVLKEEKYAPLYPQSIAGLATYERDAAQAFEFLRKMDRAKSTHQFEEIQLGTLRALVRKESGGFTIYAVSANTQFTIHYVDGRSSSNERQDYSGLLEQICRSFRF